MVLLRVPNSVFATLVPLTIAWGLWLDTAFGAVGIAAVNVWVWGLFLLLLLSVDLPRRQALLTCLVLATLGELLLTEVCAAYAYRSGSLPLYVPPGHCLLYHFGVLCSRFLPLSSANGRSFYRARVVSALIVAAAVWRLDADPVGAASAVAIAVMVWLGENRALYASMALLSLLMELLGTWLGVWTWSPVLAGTSLTVANPPLGVGILYCLLDALVLAIAKGRPEVADRDFAG